MKGKKRKDALYGRETWFESMWRLSAEEGRDDINTQIKKLGGEKEKNEYREK